MSTSSASRLSGKTVLITGASSGIGQGCAVEFARQGSNLILTARRIERLVALRDRLANDYRVKVHVAQVDVQDRAQVNKAIADIPADLKNIDVLVNNAGLVIGMESIEVVDDQCIDTMFDTNVKGLLYVTQAVLPGMKERNTGNIINISSIAGTEVYPGGGIYCATKHSVDAITRTLRMELVDTGINVCSVDPGLVETEFSVVRFRGDKDKADQVYETLTSPPLSAADVAETVAFVASRPPHVQIASMVVFPTSQAASKVVSRKK